jgi:glyoxylase-like metal-dependent hydrolase (beta-lactamase superfamily II)
MQRPIVLGAIIGTGLFAIAVAQQTPTTPTTPTTPPAGAPQFPPVDTIDQIAENLYRVPGAGGNSAVLVHANGVLLVDTKVPNNGESLLNVIKKVTDKPITHIINTHTHFDHTGSNSYFPTSVEVVTQQNTKTNMEKMDAFKSETGKVGLPDKTFKDKMTLLSGKDAVDLYYFGPAHTNGDAFVVFRNARIMHAGDAFAGKRQPLLDVNNGGSGVAFPETFAKAAKGIKNVDKVITGHSDVMPWQDFVDYGEFNRLFLEHARAALAANKTPEQALSEFKLPEKFQGYNLAPGRGGPGGNFNTIYGELRK